MIEFRIYYECLEQANDYIKPIVEEIARVHKTPITLVKRPKKAEQLPKGSIHAIQSLTTPDILITAIADNKEYPLVLVEFTESVSVEDHELQRTYGAIAAYLAGIYYIKVSGHKQSEKDFGGAEYNPYNTPRILIEEFNYEGFIIADWQTKISNKYQLQRHLRLPGCPPEIPIIKDTIQSAIKAFLQNKSGWFQHAMSILKHMPSYSEYSKKVNNANNSVGLLKAWKDRENRNRDRNNLRYFVCQSWLGAKINRFSHAMDPDRGILTFISFIFSKTHSVYGIYALVRSRSGHILKSNLTSHESLKIKLNEALKKDKGGIPEWLAEELRKVASQAKTITDEINFQMIWEKHKDKIAENKVVMTIAYFLDGLYLNHNGIKLYWDRYKLLGNKKGNFLELLKNYFGFSNYTAPTTIEEVKIEVDEDEVTYAIAHRVLIPNKFRIISISYPGSQGGGAILPEPEKGKAQPREYPDIIALPPARTNKFDALLNESKGMFNQSQVKKDMDKIRRYKKDKNLQNALKKVLVAAQVIDINDNFHKILIGVAFGSKSNTKTTWNPDEVDSIFRIVNREKWAIGIFNQGLRDLIPKISGDTNFPKVSKIKVMTKKSC